MKPHLMTQLLKTLWGAPIARSPWVQSGHAFYITIIAVLDDIPVSALTFKWQMSCLETQHEKNCISTELLTPIFICQFPARALSSRGHVIPIIWEMSHCAWVVTPGEAGLSPGALGLSRAHSEMEHLPEGNYSPHVFHSFASHRTDHS